MATTKKKTVKKEKKKVNPIGRGGARENSGPSDPFWGRGVETATISFRVPAIKKHHFKAKIDKYIARYKTTWETVETQD